MNMKPRLMGRLMTCDATIPFRMPGGIPGAVNRSHPANIEPVNQDSVAPATFYGQAVVADATSPNGVRVPKTGDTAAEIYGVTVRPYPFQPATATNYGALAFGATVAPPTTGQIDVLKSGYITVTRQGATAAAKGLPVLVTTVAGTGYVVGGFSADSVAGTQVTLAPVNQFYFNGPSDSSTAGAGNVEVAFNV